MYNPFTLAEKRILITGASSGIGRACAVEFSKLGAEVVLVARRKEMLDETLSLMDGTGHQAIRFDLSNLDQIETVLQTATKKSLLNGLVHSAGILTAMPIQSQSLDEMRNAMSLNYFAFMVLMKHFVKRKYCQGGSVVAISSVAAEAGWAGGALYSGTKGALSASVRSLAIELVPREIRVNTVAPSNIRTAMYDAVAGELNDKEGQLRLLSKQPLGLGQPEDVARVVAFLLSDGAKFLTGTQLVADGGYLAQ